MDDRPGWFAPKRYGYGAGLPVAWQGWAILAIYFLIVLGAAVGFAKRPLVVASILVPSTILFVLIAARTTKGGMRWRWGKSD